MSELIQTKTFEVDPIKTKRLKAVIDALTAGENPDAVKKEFYWPLTRYVGKTR